MLHQTDLLEPDCYYPYVEPRKQRKLKPTHAGFIAWHVVIVCYYLCTTLCRAEPALSESKLLDLTHEFDNATIYWATERPLTLNVTYNGTIQPGGYWYQKDEIYAATHGGTHLDAPCHFAQGRWCVSDIPLDRLVVPTLVVNISGKVDSNPNIHLAKDDLISWEKKHGKIPDGSLLMVLTGWSKFWPDPLKYSGTEDRNVSLLKFPSIKPEAAEWLVSNRNIVGVGIDTMSIDIPGGIPSTHVTLMEKNIYGLENVNNLDLLPPKGALVYVMPMKLKGASGAPCRLIAQVSSEVASSAASAFNFSSLLTVIVVLHIWLRFS
ncbi:isatin hydrolase-like [Uloborus diversus]|uniref:isatin hydrolase-like n=1 Tax=Uloborus diversus TaxID=327109 RepID=UPI002409B2D7|nr:isatin hydrolase-like [Uloborus diversus]